MLHLDEALLKSRLAAAYEYLIAADDAVCAAKVRELAAKLVKREFTIAFCGHFSAGKSTMINRLIGENLLPSSPIPTSANLVKVRAGDDYAKVIFKNAKPRKYLAPYDYKMVKNYCKDGDAIEAIEISHADSTLPPDTVIMDTPGIDSADDAHRIATESALHLADLILYVMDYNHVQSELNFMFTKELADAGKEVCLVINQVDKHAENELSFAKFRTGVVDSFASWGVQPTRIFYTSLKNPAHEQNQFPQLQSFMQQRLAERSRLLLHSVFCSLQRVLCEHRRSVEVRLAAETTGAQAALADLSADQRSELVDEYKVLSAERRLIAGGVGLAEEEFDAGIWKILDNAYLMPFQTRALAEKYLEAMQPNFKVGWLFTKRKTEEERQNRLSAFLTEVNEKARSQVEWHMRDFITQFLRDKHIRTDKLLAAIQELTVTCSVDLVRGALKEGASLSGDYVLHYTNDVANEIKLLAKRRVALLKKMILKELAAHYAVRRRKLADKLSGMEQYLAALERLSAAEKMVQDTAEQLEGILTAAADEAAQHSRLFCIKEPECEVVAGSAVIAPTAGKKETAVKAHTETVETVQAAAVLPESHGGQQMKDTAARLQQAAAHIASLSSFKKLAAELEDKAARLNSRGFTVALFGAFSAGKSSFANALIGQRVLPVSPNPMTAAINRIKPVDSQHAHGTVVIKLKTADVMLEDINSALAGFGLTAAGLEEALGQLEKLNEAAVPQNAAVRTSYAFLRAFGRGYPQFASQMGAAITTGLDEFADYVALEEKSCFVEWIDLYYDCPLTSQGITLVDTPGADSINARHTGVAFDYIKNSDAILFVTYYNHAFSKADREFLIQLGRVKDAFQLDKMFFVINAIDLANDEEEKQTVLAYVSEQLIKYGVRQPQLYPLSSLQALEEKIKRTALGSGMAELEAAFYQFITCDLAGMAVRAAENELKRVQELIASLIVSSHADAAEKERRKKSFHEQQTAAVRLIECQPVQFMEERLTQEIAELVYYIRQRVFFRFNEFFRESFNPGVLREDGRDLKQVLQAALAELLQGIGFDFAQEMRATTVRLDRFCEQQLRAYQRDTVSQLREINRDLSFSAFESSDAVQLEFAAAFAELDHRIFAKTLSSFKNPKAFFENGGNQTMREAIHQLLGKPADEYLAAQQERLIAAYSSLAAAELKHLQMRLTEELDEFYLGQFTALASDIDAGELQRVAALLDAL